MRGCVSCQAQAPLVVALFYGLKGNGGGWGIFLL